MSVSIPIFKKHPRLDMQFLQVFSGQDNCLVNLVHIRPTADGCRSLATGLSANSAGNHACPVAGRRTEFAGSLLRLVSLNEKKTKKYKRERERDKYLGNMATMSNSA